jgi:hypothetical protein
MTAVPPSGLTQRFVEDPNAIWLYSTCQHFCWLSQSAQ